MESDRPRRSVIIAIVCVLITGSVCFQSNGAGSRMLEALGVCTYTSQLQTILFLLNYLLCPTGIHG